MASGIHFNSIDVNVPIKQRKALSAFMIQQLKEFNKGVESVTFVFCTDLEIIKVNTQFLRHNYATDIITFDLSEKPNLLVSDIYISIDSVKENAKRYKTPFLIELHRVMFHGLLHLCGFMDKSKQQKLTMRTMEDQWLSHYFVSRETE